MIGGSEINPDQWKQQARYLDLRGAQMAGDRAEQKPSAASHGSRGRKRQLIGTIIGVAAVFGVLVLLSVLR